MNAHSGAPGAVSRRAVLVALPLLCGGCATTYEGGVDPTWFPRAPPPPDALAPGRLAVLMPPALRDRVHEDTQGVARGVRLPVGRIVEQALLAAAGDAWRDGAHAVAEAPRAGSGFTATLAVDSVRIEHSDTLSWLNLTLVLGDRNVFTRLVIELSLLDAAGRPVWTHTYDSGREMLTRPSFWRNETAPVGLTRMAHEIAWRLSQKALGEVRAWQATERNQPREF